MDRRDEMLLGGLVVAAWGLAIAAIGWAAEGICFLLWAGWVVIVNAAKAIIEAVDEWLPEFEIAESAWARALVIGGSVAVVTVLVSPWALLASLAGALVGVVADPEKSWRLSDFAGLRGRGGPGPKMPLNL